MGGVIEELLQPVPLPRMVRIQQIFGADKVEDVAAEVRNQIESRQLLERISPGQSIAVTAGSRGIADLPIVIREIVTLLKSAGAKPFIVPAMGSHGGATAEGQTEMLRGMGITEDTVGAPIRATMEVVQIGTSSNGLPCFMDKYAADADGIVIVNRIKPHVAFRGPYESGLMKMITIGLGKQKGADTCHNLGFGRMAENIPAIAKVALEKKNLVMAIGILENAYDQTRRIVALGREEIERDEPALLREAKANMPKILFDEFDVLIIDEIGKDISGTGLDTGVVGRYHSPYADDGSGPKVNKMAVLDLTERSHGNANGIGIVDYTTRRVFDKMDFEQTYPNSLTSTVPLSVKIPMVLANDKQAIQACIKCANIVDKVQIRLVRIKSTLDLKHIEISENMVPSALANPNIEILSEPYEMNFDQQGNLF